MHEITMYEIAMHEIAMHEIAMHEITMHEIAMHEIAMHEIAMHIFCIIDGRLSIGFCTPMCLVYMFSDLLKGTSYSV